MSLFTKKFFAFFFFLLISQSLVFGQGITTAAMNGVVTDKDGTPLAGATVIAQHIPSGTDFGTTTRTDGRFNLLNLRVGGPYSLKVTFIGYKTQTQEGITLALGQNLKIDFKLLEQEVELSGVTVVAEKSSVMSQARTGSSQNISLADIQEVPTISRSFQNYAKLSPMFTGDGLNAAGRSNKYNNIQIDGAQYNDMFGLGTTGLPGGQTSMNPISMDAIEEFQVVVAPFDVRYGGFTGGGINAITKSGTNSFDGSAYFYGRNESLTGKNWDDTKVTNFKDYQYGFHLGGPVISDKLFFSIAGELTDYTFPVDNVSLTAGIANAASYAERFASIMKNTYGYNPGSYLTFDAERPSSKMLIRFDYNLSENHKLTLRHNYTYGYDDNMNNRNNNKYLSFDTYNYRIRNITNSTVLQLTSTLSNQISNDLILGYTSIRDRRHGTSATAPEIDVAQSGMTIYAGPDRYSSANELDQDVFEFTDNFTYYAGEHVFTAGTHNEFFSFRNLFLRDYYGYLSFDSLAALESGTYKTYSRTISRTNDPFPAAEFSVAQFGFYVQDEWTILPELKLTYGVRVDIPTFPDTPAKNDSVSKYVAGYKTDVVPKSSLLWSPRFGFNYDPLGDRSTQIRGGAGIFTGKVPYVWISNSYGNTGMTATTVTSTTTSLYDLINNPLSASVSKSNTKAEIDLHDADLKMPQVLRFDLAVDQQLPYEFIGTVEFQYSKSLNDMIYRKINVGPATSSLDNESGRPVYSSSTYTNTTYNNNFTNIFQVYNTSEGYQYDFTLQLQRNVAKGLSINAGYRYEQSKDKNSASSSQASSQWNYNPIGGDPNSPDLTTSLYEVPHRIYASVAYTFEYFKDAPTTISIFYNGQSGNPFSFTVKGDVNGDGSTYNDLFYIPKNSSDIYLGSSTSSASVGDDNNAMWQQLNSFIENNKYLSDHRGQLAERNASTSPWKTTFDVRIAQQIPDLWGMGRFQLSLDIINVFNLINKDWGHYDDVSWYYQIVTYKGLTTDKKNAVYEFTKPTYNTAWSSSYSLSKWAMQIGLRYSFSGLGL